tara:strand:- start:48 stop:251 length:204 start_codon:yes stop_codon:yes gene_type:complete
MAFWDKFTTWLGFETVRNRDEKGRYVADDKSTPDVNEAYKKVYKSKLDKISKMAEKIEKSKKTRIKE